jgi:NADH-quinone oxidoreductase subunit M
MIDWPILSIVTFLPLVGVALILLIRGDDDIAQRNIRNIALFTTIVTFIVSLFIWGGFDSQPRLPDGRREPVARRVGHLQDGC